MSCITIELKSPYMPYWFSDISGIPNGNWKIDDSLVVNIGLNGEADRPGPVFTLCWRGRKLDTQQQVKLEIIQNGTLLKTSTDTLYISDLTSIANDLFKIASIPYDDFAIIKPKSPMYEVVSSWIGSKFTELSDDRIAQIREALQAADITIPNF